MFRLSTLFIIFVFHQTDAEATSFCSKTFLKPEGSFSFPIEGCDGGHAWEFWMKSRQSLRISPRSVHPRKITLQVQGKRLARDEYETIQTVTMETDDVIIRPPMKFVKIIMEETDGSFTADYEVFSCEVPSSLSGRCSNGHRKRSTCEFKCKSPRYFPAGPNDISIQTKCGSNNEWTTSLEGRCIEMHDLEEKRFSGDFKTDIVGIPERQKRNTDDQAFIEWQLTADPVSLVCVTLGICNRNQTGSFSVQCSHYNTTETSGLCMMCRYTLGLCDAPDIPIVYL